MRKQVRPSKPAVLHQHGDRLTQQWIELRGRNPNAQFSWYQVEKQSVRDRLLPLLRDMTQAHCSFCDCFPLEDRSKTPIEHFKPKSDSRFYLHAYEWENLFYSCELCQSSKREQWNDALLRPDADDYTFTRYFEFDYTTGAIKPNPMATEVDQKSAQITINFYGLDLDSRRRYRRLELRKWQPSHTHAIDDFAYRDFLEIDATNTADELGEPIVS